MASAQLYFEDVSVGEDVRPMMVWMDQMQLVEWGDLTGNHDAGHWHIYHNRWKETADPTVSVRKGQEPSVTGQFKTALFEKMLMDWGGPKAWVQKMSVQYRVWDYFFELKTFTGKVTAKREEHGDNLIDVELQMANEEGTPTTKVTATLSLPIRGK